MHMQDVTKRVFLIDDDAMVAETVESFLGSDPLLEFVGHEDEALPGVQRVAQGDIHLLLVDVRLRSSNGFEVVKTLARQAAEVKCLLLSSMPPADALERALEARAYGLLSKGCGSQMLQAACHAAWEGCFALDPLLYPSLWGTSAKEREIVRVGPDHPVPLSPRELEVFTHLCAARSNRMIARALGVSENTAKTHVANLMRKTGVTSRGQLALLVVENGVVQPTDQLR